jgi:diaminohydroxyphosphoribosylaminopyrimidine deaminase/5-amino-6-(5-phosphoribosylamino)uracil reductase
MTDQDHHTEELFMQRAVELATRGLGYVSPNPLVGCVIVHDGTIIGEGWHKKYGQAHAEVNAVNSVQHKSLLRNSTVYVNLEPCSHTGKTPPCADMLIREQVKKVVIANEDSNPLVAGKGIMKLRSAGIEVVTDMLAEKGRALNKRFFTFMERQRPYIILKWAQTQDGFIARENYDSKWISGELSRQLVHKWRTEEDAVLVGSHTAQYDNPQLTVRDWTGRNPVRVVLDRFLKLDNKLVLFDQQVKTFRYNVLKNEDQHNKLLIKVTEQNFLQEVIHNLCVQKIQSVIIEGGAQTLQAFIDLQLWDEARVFVSPMMFNKGIHAPKLQGQVITRQILAADELIIYKQNANQLREQEMIKKT